jgi:uncharacterized protein with beta-barrel porin domain
MKRPDLLTAPALGLVILASTSAALADGGRGGDSGSRPAVVAGGAGGGGAFSNGVNGGSGASGGGGGGGGVNLVTGLGGSGGAGGTGAPANGGNGGNAASFSVINPGGGVTINAAGAAGGAGAPGQAFAGANGGGGGGGGGEGGGGLFLPAPANSTVTGAVTGGTGGAGGAGGNGSTGDGGAGGSGGSGGIAVFVAAPNSSLTVDGGSLVGGRGGAGGSGGSANFITGFGGGRGNGGFGGAGAAFANGGQLRMLGGSIAGGAGENGADPAVGIFSFFAGALGGAGGAGVSFTGNGSIAIDPGASNAITGGAGGRGGTGTLSAAGGTAGGAGGDGGAGIRWAGQGTLSNSGTIQGGQGGAGGAARAESGGLAPAGGNGGAGGAGVVMGGGTLTNSGSIIAGNGGAVGLGNRGLVGVGGVGVSGAGLTIINGGTISGGLSGDGSQRANAVTFTGGANIFELRSGSTVTGNVVAFSTVDTFRLGGATNGTFDVSQLGPAAQFRGFGIDEKNGSSTWTLTGTTVATTPWTVNAGTLSVNGSIAASSMTTVNAGGTLGGNGTVGNTTINGGTLAPGNSIGLLTVQGNLVFTAAASYLIEVSPANADRTNVTGTATLGGATVNASFAAGSYVNKQYTIVNATGGVSGTFNSVVNSNVPANFTSSLSYDANNAYLNLALNFVPNPAPNFGGGLNGNQQNVANTLVNFFNGTGGIPLVFGSLTPAGLTIASGELPTAAQQTTFDAMNLFLGLLTDPFVAGRGNPVSSSAGAPQFADESDAANAYAANGKPRTKSERDAYAAVYRKAPVLADPFTQRWSVWAAGYGGSQTTDGNTVLGSNNTKSSIGGVAVGADYRFSPNTLAGFAIAGGGTSFSVNGLGSGRSDLFQAGAFLRHTVGPAYITAALAYGWQDITTDRTVTIAGTDVLRANFNANAFSGRVEGGYRFVTPWMAMGITPYAAGQATTFELPAYAEQVVAGANTFALTYGAKDVTASRSELGLRSDKSYPMQDAIFTLRGRAAWAHNFNTDRNVGATFQTLPGASFVVNGAAQASDSALVTGSAEMKWLNGFSLAGTFEGEFSNVTASYAGKGVVRYAW